MKLVGMSEMPLVVGEMFVGMDKMPMIVVAMPLGRVGLLGMLGPWARTYMCFTQAKTLSN